MESQHSMEQNLSTTELSRRKKSKKSRRTGKTIMVFFLSVLVWASLAYGGYRLGFSLINQSTAALQQSIDDVKESNALQLQRMTEQMKSLEFELQLIEESINQTDSQLSDSNTTREALINRITELDKQLEELKKSLQKLKENTRG
ncbi:hypothetical protein L1765_06825 [Microaerobacter geothermalis]|uniref:hypothetical protein n=1 Tax=Microaerobacter geothermalis TaxID=674972 RepID=UPI001F43BF7E|nr:hypothetical protein [Microaerobacter geothermalis]MCF6093701.1 hypothetical protein [Microaerobacter geothermalis]